MYPKAMLFALFLAVPYASIALAQTSAPTLEERMSQDEFNSSGLDKLSAEQLKFLNGWIQSKGISAMGAPIKHRDGSTDFYADSDRERIESSIVGTFNGWRGKTRVTLENGQVWEQAEGGSKGDSLNSPKVVIKPMSFGSWLMYVDGCGCDIRVQRVK